MSFSFQKTYELKQQTPLIHFQYDQQGATLRATEVKPKLDRYLISRYAAEHPNEEIPSDWWINPDKDKTNEVTVKALNYRMTIAAKDNKIIMIGPHTDFDLYYGNMKNSQKKQENSDKQGVFSKDIRLSIFCRESSLLSWVGQNIENFFLSHNFGTMQRKGFGSYVIGNPSCEQAVNALCDHFDSDCCYCFPANNLPFVRIKTIYSIIKSGINLGNRGYRRSLLFMFLHTSPYQICNEKAFLKQKKMAPAIYRNRARHIEQASNEPARYVRALLGTGENLEYRDQRYNEIKQKYVSTVIDKIRIHQNTIERLKSPIFFKVVGDTVYYVGEPINPIAYGKEFTFTSTFSEGNRYAGPVLRLKVPEEKEIGSDFLKKFLDFCCVELNLSQTELNAKYPGSNYTCVTAFNQMEGVFIQKKERK